MLRRMTLISLFAGLALLAAACSPQASLGQDATVRPITDILASGPEFTGIGPISATLLVETTLPAARTPPATNTPPGPRPRRPLRANPPLRCCRPEPGWSA